MPLSVSAGYVELFYVEDQAFLLTDDQWSSLEDRAEDLSSKYRCDVRILTVLDMADYGFRNIEDFSYYVYTEHGFGYGSDRDCVLLVLSMEQRDYDLRVWGNRANTAFTLYGIDNLLDKHVLPPLGNNDFYRAFSAYIDRAEVYLEMAENGRPFDTDSDPASIASKLIGVIIVSFLIALLICMVWKSKHKTAKLARTADSYIPPGGFRLTGQGDTFLYRTTTRVKIQQ